jgi:putrescine transport system permease protein
VRVRSDGVALFRLVVLGLPFLWLAIFVVLPFLITLKVSFAQSLPAQPPFSPLFLNGRLDLHPSGSYGRILSDRLYLSSYMQALRFAATTSLLCALIGFPLAYGISRSSERWRPLLLLGVMLPFWTSFLIRVYAWTGLLKNTGLINKALLWLGLIDEPLGLINTPFAVYLVMVYVYLPFMVLPLYAALEKLDHTLLEAAADLGCRPTTAFFYVTLPLSAQGIVAGSLLVFVPAVGEYVVPELMGGASAQVIGRTLFAEFFANRDWPTAAALGVVAMLILAIPVALMQRLDDRRIRGAKP